MRVLVVNAGSSSVKLSVVGAGDEVLAGVTLVRRPGQREPATLDEGLDRFLDGAPPFDAVGHRVVHGGSRFEGPLLVDAGSEAALAALADLAPLHNPPALEAIEDLARRRPALPQVACFDTSFHATMPDRASTYAVPDRWRREWGIRRFGFHGLSHAWASRRAAQLLDRPPAGLRVVTAHLGSGASLAAVAGGRSVDTTMGFTPIEGVVMATRSGSVDPGALLWALRHGGLGAEEAEADLELRSGLLGLSGRTGDLREVIERADAGDAACGLAYEVYVYRLQTAAGAMAVALGDLDALVFTGGAGEGSARLRADVCAGLGLIGVAPIDERGAPVPLPGDGNGEPDPGDRVVSGPQSRAAVLVVHAREDLEIARAVRELLSS